MASVQVPPLLQAYTRAGTMTRPVAGRKCERRTERNGVKREICRGRAEVCRNLDMRLRIHYQILVQRVAQRRLRLGYLANETTQPDPPTHHGPHSTCTTQIPRPLSPAPPPHATRTPPRSRCLLFHILGSTISQQETCGAPSLSLPPPQPHPPGTYRHQRPCLLG